MKYHKDKYYFQCENCSEWVRYTLVDVTEHVCNPNKIKKEIEK